MKILFVALLMLVCLPSTGHNQDYYFPFSTETIKLTSKILKFAEKKNYHLEYKSIYDLQESVDIIVKQSKVSKFNKYEIATVVMIESRFNQFAKSKVGAVGLGQLYNIKRDYKKELFWVNNPYDKHQNIISSIIILQDKHKMYKTKHMAYVRYNGKVCKDSLYYAQKVNRMKNELMKS